MTAKELTQPRISHPQCDRPCACFPDIEAVISDPAVRDWLKTTLIGAVALDSEDVAADAEVLANILGPWANHQIRDHSPRA